MDFLVNRDKVIIYDSFLFNKRDFETCLEYIEDIYNSDVFKNRTIKSLKREWAIFNFLHDCGIWTDRTTNVLFKDNLTKIEKILINSFGSFAYWLIS